MAADLCAPPRPAGVTDEVYEHLVFDGAHVPLASLPGMRERTVTISSAGKTFSLTGWKIGWTCAPPASAAAVRAAHQFVTFAVATPFQHAMAAALGGGRRLLRASSRAEYRTRRDRLCDGLADGRLRRSRAGRAPTSRSPTSARSATTTTSAFCRMLPERVGVAAIPASAFAHERAPVATWCASPSARTTRRSTRGCAGSGRLKG